MCTTAAQRWSHSSAWRRRSPPLGETTWSEILDLRARILRETTDARLDAKRGTSDQPGSPGRNAPAGILICGSLPGGLVCRGGRSDPSVQHLPGGDGLTNAGISMAVVGYAAGTIGALL